MPDQKPSVGRFVHYVMLAATDYKLNAQGDYERVPAHRPAIIVRVWERPDDEEPLVQLQVFTDGTNDGQECVSGLIWATSVVHDEEHKSRGTWHWPESI